MPYEFHDTAHAEKRARHRGFTIEQATLTINKPASILKNSAAQGKPQRFRLVVLSRV